MLVLFITIGIILISYARISRTYRVFNGKAKPFSSFTQDEVLIQWIGVAFIAFSIILSI